MVTSGRRARAWLWVVAAVLASVGTLTACGEREVGPPRTPIPEPVAEPTISVEQAQQTYHPLVAAVAEAVADVSVPGRPEADDHEVIYYAGDLESCVYSSLGYEFDTVFGFEEGASWDDVRAATAQVLEPAGFKLTEQLYIPGANHGFDASTDDGTRVEVRAQGGGPSRISLSAPVLGYCDRDSNETLPPMPN